MKKVLTWLLCYMMIGLLVWLYARFTGGIASGLTSVESLTTFIGFVLFWPYLLAAGIAKSLI
jgi:hypothetical protein